jgi:H+-transporting ATPase
MAEGSSTAQPARFDEKDIKPADPAPQIEDDEELEDIDALIDELESQDGHGVDEEDEESPTGGRTVPEEMLQTSTVTGYAGALGL